MARITGFRCDAPKCDNVSETEALPIGWMTLAVIVDPKSEPKPDTSTFHICSNQCLKRLGAARYTAAIERGDEEKPGWMKARESAERRAAEKAAAEKAAADND